MSAPRVTIIGGSVAGLSLGLLLARRGIPATILERDPTVAGDDVGSAGAAPRRATPQARHSHAFLARARAILLDELPATYEAMLEAGVREAPLPYAGPGATKVTSDDEVIVINARRSVFEWVLRRAAEAEPLVDLRLGAGADGIVLDDTSTRVQGLIIDREELAADVIVDASGKRSAVSGWLGADNDEGFDVVACGISYVSRFYRLLDGEPTALNRGFTHGASFDRYSCLVFPADNGTFSVTFGVLPEDRPMRALLDGAGFDAAASSIEGIAPWVDPSAAVPLDDPSLMAGLANRYTDQPSAGRPRGLLRVGDALCVTNPAHTRGTTLAMVGAQHLAEAIAAHGTHGDDIGDALAVALDDLDHAELAPWFADSVEQDAVRLQRWRPDEVPERSPGPHHRLSNGETYVAASADPVLWQAFTQLQSSLALPADVLDDPEIERRVRAVQATGHKLPGLGAPDHDGLVALAEAARARPPVTV